MLKFSPFVEKIWIKKIEKIAFGHNLVATDCSLCKLLTLLDCKKLSYIEKLTFKIYNDENQHLNTIQWPVTVNLHLYNLKTFFLLSKPIHVRTFRYIIVKNH